MHYSHILQLELSVEAKYFLVLFVREYERNELVTLKVRELSNALEMNPRMVKKCTDLLVKKNFLRRKKVSLGNEGRPSFTYEYGDKLKEHLEEWESSDHVNKHEHQIGRILSKDFSKKKGGSQKVLKAPAKVLLAALLLRADKRGVVKGLEKGALEQLAGMSKERLKSQMRSLSKTEYLDLYIHGMVNTPIFGSTRSIYVLNFKSTPMPGELQKIILNCKDASYFVYQTASDKEEGRADSINCYAENSPITPYPIDIDSYLPQRTIGNIKKLLVFKIHKFAIDMLKDDFDKDDSGKSTSDNELSHLLIKNRLREDLFPKASTEDSSSSLIPKANQNDLVEWVFMVSLYVARKVMEASQIASAQHTESQRIKVGQKVPADYDLKKAIFIERLDSESITLSMEA